MHQNYSDVILCRQYLTKWQHSIFTRTAVKTTLTATITYKFLFLPNSFSLTIYHLKRTLSFITHSVFGCYFSFGTRSLKGTCTKTNRQKLRGTWNQVIALSITSSFSANQTRHNRSARSWKWRGCLCLLYKASSALIPHLDSERQVAPGLRR